MVVVISIISVICFVSFSIIIGTITFIIIIVVAISFIIIIHKSQQ